MIQTFPKLFYHVAIKLLDLRFTKDVLTFAQTTTRVFSKGLEGSRFAYVVEKLCKPKFMHLMGAFSFTKSALNCCRQLYRWSYSVENFSYDVVNLTTDSLDILALRKIVSKSEGKSATHRFVENIQGPTSVVMSIVDYNHEREQFQNYKEMDYTKRKWHIAQFTNAARFASGAMLTLKWVRGIKSPGFERVLDIIDIASIALNFISAVNGSYSYDNKKWFSDTKEA